MLMVESGRENCALILVYFNMNKLRKTEKSVSSLISILQTNDGLLDFASIKK